MSFANLPLEVFGLIFELLDPQSVLAYRSLSKLWKSAVDHPLWWRRICYFLAGFDLPITNYQRYYLEFRCELNKINRHCRPPQMSHPFQLTTIPVQQRSPHKKSLEHLQLLIQRKFYRTVSGLFHQLIVFNIHGELTNAITMIDQPDLVIQLMSEIKLNKRNFRSIYGGCPSALRVIASSLSQDLPVNQILDLANQFDQPLITINLSPVSPNWPTVIRSLEIQKTRFQIIFQPINSEPYGFDCEILSAVRKIHQSNPHETWGLLILALNLNCYWVSAQLVDQLVKSNFQIFDWAWVSYLRLARVSIPGYWIFDSLMKIQNNTEWAWDQIYHRLFDEFEVCGATLDLVESVATVETLFNRIGLHSSQSFKLGIKSLTKLYPLRRPGSDGTLIREFPLLIGVYCRLVELYNIAPGEFSSDWLGPGLLTSLINQLKPARSIQVTTVSANTTYVNSYVFDSLKIQAVNNLLVILKTGKNPMTDSTGKTYSWIMVRPGQTITIIDVGYRSFYIFDTQLGDHYYEPLSQAISEAIKLPVQSNGCCVT